FSSSVPPRALPSFPTRRSSDLFRRRLFLSEARLEPPEDSQESRAASCGSDLFARKRKWHPNLRVKIPQAETAGHHADDGVRIAIDRKSTRLNSSHVAISYAVFC